MMRIFLFLATNVAVLALASITLSVLGVGSALQANGVDLDLTNLLIIAAVFGFGGAFVSLFMSKWLAKMSTRTQIIKQPANKDQAWLVDMVEELARQAGIKSPEVGFFVSDQPNAFATGWNRNNALVSVSTGLLKNFRQDEIRAVLAHEIGHVANGDMVTLTLIQGVVNTFVIFLARIIGHVVDRVILKNDRGYGLGYFVTTIVAQIVLGILASTIVFWFSRQREYRADAMGAKLAGSGAMISALERLKKTVAMPDEMPENLQAFGISSGVRKGLRALFASHPPLDERIKALQENRFS
jgi:heat shock protein HtpX